MFRSAGVLSFAPVVTEPLLSARSITVFGVTVSCQKVAVLVTAAVLAATLASFLQRTRFGTAVRAEPPSRRAMWP